VTTGRVTIVQEVYRETEGIKQWRKEEVYNDGQRFATLDVTGVEFFNEMRPEFRRPGQ
jgi:hypothetical protein